MVVGEVNLTLTESSSRGAGAAVSRPLAAVASLVVVSVLSSGMAAVTLAGRTSLAGAASAASAVTGSSVRSLAASH